MRGSFAVLGLLLAVAPANLAAEMTLEQKLASGLPANREKAAAALGKQGDTSAAKRLIALLGDKDWGVRIAAVRALGPISYGPGRDALFEQALKGEIRAIRRAAAEALRDHAAAAQGRRIGRYLTKLKGDARTRGIEALAVIGGKDGIAALAKQMRAPDKEHRAAAARALARQGAGEEALLGALKDREEPIAILALIALAMIDSDSARAGVIDRLEKIRDLTESYTTRRVGRAGAKANKDAFAKALSERIAKAKKPGPLLQTAWYGRLTGCAAAAAAHFKHRDPLTRAFAFRVAGLGSEPLPKALVDGGLKHKDRRVRYGAADAALRAAGAERIEVLKSILLHKTGDVAMVGVRYATERRIKGALPELALIARGKTAAKKDWQLRAAACVAIGRVGYDRDFSALEELATARKWWLKAAALEGLYHTYRKEAIPLLLASFDDKHPVVRMTARRNLRYMTQQTFSKKSMYEGWWEKRKATIEFKHPEHKLKELKRYGYSTRKFIQDILRGTDIVAVKGRWDKVELILEDLGVRHQAVRQQQLKDYGVSAKQIILVNCEGSIDSTVTHYLQWLVVVGGYMATTDWSLVNATTKTFPRVVKGYVKQSTGNDVVIVEPAAPDHPTLSGVFRPDVELQWWLEIQAFPIAIEDPLRCTVLVDSLEMYSKYGSSAMMVEFQAGLGKVLHSTSHFYLQKEGFAHASGVNERKIFAADHLGLTIEEIRELDGKGAFGNINNTTPISKSYSMFHLLVNFIDEKRRSDMKR